MGFKQTKLYSILTFTCPRCHEGRYFEKAANYRRGFADVRRECEHCGEDFRREPGFYFGAAYASYALTVALWVAVYVALVVFDAIGLMEFSFHEDGFLFLIIGSLVLLALMPPLYRMSRLMWINLFVEYREDAVEYNLALRREKEERRSGLTAGDPSV